MNVYPTNYFSPGWMPQSYNTAWKVSKIWNTTIESDLQIRVRVWLKTVHSFFKTKLGLKADWAFPFKPNLSSGPLSLIPGWHQLMNSSGNWFLLSSQYHFLLIDFQTHQFCEYDCMLIGAQTTIWTHRENLCFTYSKRRRPSTMTGN